ncbi:hypothetical protein KGM_205745A, partial [Danaus plexippus plexippus]
MNEKSAKSSALPAGVVIVINLLSMILCIFVFAVSLLSIAAPSTLLYIINSFGSSFMKVSVRGRSPLIVVAVHHQDRG